MTQSNRSLEALSQQKIGSLFWQYALPSIIGAIVNTLYNIIDGIFIGHWVGKEALSALGVVLPVMNIAAGVGMLVGVGSASHISICLGLKDHAKAEKIVATSLLLTLVLSGTVLLAMLIFLRPLLMFVGASEVTYPPARDFLQIFLPGSLFLTLCFNFNTMMRSCGYPLKAMITMLISVVANIILAPLFILILGWGMRGAAIATVISMAISFGFVLHHFIDGKSIIQFKKENLSLEWSAVKSILSIGLSPFFVQMATSVIVILINFQLHRYTVNSSISADDAIAAFSNANRLIMLVVMIIVGLTQGMQPIIGYNFGARNIDRVKKTLTYAIVVATGVSTCGFLLGFLIPEFFVKAFSSDTEIVSLSATALHYVTLAFPVIGLQIVVSNFFLCIGMAKKSIFLSLSRQILFLIPALFILPPFLGVNGVWLANPLADFIATSVAVVMLIYQMRALEKRQVFSVD